MRLVFIYGPPAVGKLAVATELAKLTGFKLHHNHVSIDFVRSIFEFSTPPYSRLVDKYRREMLEEAAKENVDTIFTFVYGKEWMMNSSGTSFGELNLIMGRCFLSGYTAVVENSPGE